MAIAWSSGLHIRPKVFIWNSTGALSRCCYEWLGRRGMRWPALLPLLLNEQRGPPLQVLLLHLEGNNLGLIKGKAFIIQAKGDLAELKVQWPGVCIAFSALLPCQIWQGQGDPRCLDKARRKVNWEMKKAMVAGLGQFLPHPDIQVEFVRTAFICRMQAMMFFFRISSWSYKWHWAVKWGVGLSRGLAFVLAG